MEALTWKQKTLAATAKSPVYGVLDQPSMIDFPGRMCRVMFVAGCNFRCPYCHNSALIEPKEDTISWSELNGILHISRENWVHSVCISGGEPTMHPGLEELILRLKRSGFMVKLDTNGSLPRVLENLLPNLDYVAIDYKAPLGRYRAITGCSWEEAEHVAESVEILRAWDHGAYELRTTVLEGFHTEEDMKAICRETGGAKRYVLQGYVPSPGVKATDAEWLKKRTSPSLLRRYYEICKDHFGETLVRGG